MKKPQSSAFLAGIAVAAFVQFSATPFAHAESVPAKKPTQVGETAAEEGVTTRFGEGLYVRVDGGFLFPKHRSRISTSGGGSSSTEVEEEYHVGRQYSGAIGYIVNSFVRVELEVGKGTFRPDAIVTTTTTTTTIPGDPPTIDITTDTDSVNFSGKIGMITASGNVLFDLISWGAFSGHIGAGLGATRVDRRIRTIDGAPVNDRDITVNITSSFVAGAEYAFDDHVRLGLRYRYNWTNNQDGGFENLTTQALTGNLSIRF